MRSRTSGNIGFSAWLDVTRTSRPVEGGHRPRALPQNPSQNGSGLPPKGCLALWQIKGPTLKFTSQDFVGFFSRKVKFYPLSLLLVLSFLRFFLARNKLLGICLAPTFRALLLFVAWRCFEPSGLNSNPRKIPGPVFGAAQCKIQPNIQTGALFPWPIWKALRPLLR